MHFVQAKALLSPQNGMNPYRGCTHGCIYCDSRSRVYGMTHAFEDIEVKENAPELLEKALRGKRKKCMISTGAMSDPYMPWEKDLRITRKCLEIIRRYGFGAAVQTKSDLVLRDLELLKEINETAKSVVQLTLTTADDRLCGIIEPNVCPTSRRAEVLGILRDNSVPAVVWLSPFLPFINDTEENLRALLDICAEVQVKGIVCFGIGLTLREGDREDYYQALDRHFPGLKRRYCEKYGNSYELPSVHNDRLMGILEDFCREHDILYRTDDVFGYLREFPQLQYYEQLRMF